MRFPELAMRLSAKQVILGKIGSFTLHSAQLL
jgi:hypothetical protein